MVEEISTALGDIRVLDLTGELGAYCTKLLADLGADVIKIEPPGGDPARNVGPFYHDEVGPEKSLYFLNLNTSKRGITLNLESADGREVFQRLVPTADIIVESFPPGHLDGLGLGYEGLQKLRPDIILTSITGFGAWGPHAHYLAPDIVGVAMSGIMFLAGDPEDPPNLAYGNQGYLSASLQGAAGTMMALCHRDVTGEGQQVDVSMQEALLIAQETAMQGYNLGGIARGRAGSGASLPFSIPGIGIYATSDGWAWSYVGAPGGAPWVDLLKWMEEEGKAEDLGEEPYRPICEQFSAAFLTPLILDEAERERLIPILEHMEAVVTPFFASKTTRESYEEGQARRLLIGAVSSPEDLVKNTQLNARNWYQDVEHPELGEALRFPGPPYRFSETPWRIARRAPLLGEHNAEVLSELGYSQEEIEGFAASGAT